MRQVWIPIVLAGLLVPALIAQQPAPPAQRATGVVKSDATAILVDVVVRDRRGDPILDLTAADFEIEEDGVEQQVGSVTLFAAPEPQRQPTTRSPSPRRPHVGGAEAADRAPRRRRSLRWCSTGSRPKARSLAHKAALGYVAKAEPNSMIGVFGIDLSLKIYQGYTRDADAAQERHRGARATGARRSSARAGAPGRRTGLAGGAAALGHRPGRRLGRRPGRGARPVQRQAAPHRPP